MKHAQKELILAPMVRVGSLPMRLLALKYGATKVYSPETIDKRLIATSRKVNLALNTVDYWDPNDRLCLRIHRSEIPNLVVQLGSASPELALKAALHIQQDCSGIDLNCGCPESFSISGGMGAALLSNPDTLVAILTNLVANLSIPVTCKIRILPDIENTIALMKRIEATGVTKIAVHCRLRDERPRDKVHWDVLERIISEIKIPIIANGDVYTASDIAALSSMGVQHFMVARAAQWNPSIFGPLRHMMCNQSGCSLDNTKCLLNTTELPIFEVCQEYTKLAIMYQMPLHNAKYSLQQMSARIPKMKSRVVIRRLVVEGGTRGVPKVERWKDLEFSAAEATSQAKSFQELCQVFGLEDFNLSGEPGIGKLLRKN